jgi:hypothetical protein
MSLRYRLLALAAAGVLLPATAGPAAAARIRYHYTPEAPSRPCLKAPAAGERLTLRGWQAYNCPPPKATALVTFRHPCTGQAVTLPLALPASTPRMEYTNDRVIYDYGSDTVEVSFLPDGSANVVYDTGLLRAP